MPKRPAPTGSVERWKTFLRNHAPDISAMDFFTVPTVSFRVLYVFVAIHHGSRRVLHVNVTDHPTSPWVVQQLREAFPGDDVPRFLMGNLRSCKRLALVLGLFMWAFSGCQVGSGAILSGAGESCTKTADCEWGLKCVAMVCVVDDTAEKDTFGEADAAAPDCYPNCESQLPPQRTEASLTAGET
jgi:hypothetical protein